MQRRTCPTCNGAGFLGDDLRSHRKRLGLSLREMSRRTGIPYQTLQCWETGKRWSRTGLTMEQVKERYTKAAECA